MIRVLIVDDQALFRAGLRALLGDARGVSVVAEAGNADAALRECAAAQPHVVLMDMRMPQVDGAECTRRLLAQFDSVAVIALTTFDDDGTVFEALRAGASGYLLKDVAADDLVAAIEAVANGKSIVEPSVLTKLLGEFRRVSALSPSRAQAHGLSEREAAVLQLVASGKSNKEIGAALHIAEGTVKNHLTSVFEKLGVKDRTSAAMRALEFGVVGDRR